MRPTISRSPSRLAQPRTPPSAPSPPSRSLATLMPRRASRAMRWRTVVGLIGPASQHRHVDGVLDDARGLERPQGRRRRSVRRRPRSHRPPRRCQRVERARAAAEQLTEPRPTRPRCPCGMPFHFAGRLASHRLVPILTAPALRVAGRAHEDRVGGRARRVDGLRGSTCAGRGQRGDAAAPSLANSSGWITSPPPRTGTTAPSRASHAARPSRHLAPRAARRRPPRAPSRARRGPAPTAPRFGPVAPFALAVGQARPIAAIACGQLGWLRADRSPAAGHGRPHR